MSDERTIRVFWTCGQAESCTNAADPGRHGERDDAARCLGYDVPEVSPRNLEERFRQFMVELPKRAKL